MPCHTPEPSNTQIQRQKTAALLVYVKTQLDHDIPKGLVIDASRKGYDLFDCNTDYAPELCAILSSLPEDQIEKIVYNSRNRQARDLANWWEDHQAYDRQRVVNDIDLQVGWWVDNLHEVANSAIRDFSPCRWAQILRNGIQHPGFMQGLKVQLGVLKVENYKGFKILNLPVDGCPALWLFGILPDGVTVRMAMLVMAGRVEVSQGKGTTYSSDIAENVTLVEKHFSKGMIDQLKSR